MRRAGRFARSCRSWRKLAAPTKAAVLLGLLVSCGHPGRHLIFVSNEGSGTITVIDGDGDSVLYTIPVGTRPRGIRATKDGRHVYVALSGSPRCPPTMPDDECERLVSDKSKDGIGELDVARRALTRVLPGGSDPETFDLSGDGRRLFVSNEDANAASIVDRESGRVIKTVPVGREPEGVRVHPSGQSVWITGETDNDLTILDPEGARLGRVEVCRRPRDLVFTGNGETAYASCEVGGAIAVVDAKRLTLLRTIPLPEGSRPMGLVLSPDGTRLYVANGRGGTVSVVRTADDSILATIPVGTRPWGLGLSPDGRRLYTANGPSNDVSVIDTERLAMLRRISAGELPWGITISN